MGGFGVKSWWELKIIIINYTETDGEEDDEDGDGASRYRYSGRVPLRSS